MIRHALVLAAVCLVPNAAWARGCPPVAGVDAVLTPGARVIFGEMHGTVETPRLVGDVVCHAAARGPVRLGLEIFSDEQPRLDAFVASAGGAAERKALLAGPFWTRSYQDGRNSTAMLALLDRVRALRRGGADVAVVAFDVPSTLKKGDRDALMADNLAAAFARAPQATFVMMVGNLHARKAKHPRFSQTFMAQRLVAMQQPVVSLDGDYALGTAWVCMPVCGPHVIGRGPAAPVGITLAATRDGAYDGHFSVGAPTFAPPAVRAPTPDEQAAAAAVTLELQARRTLDAGQLARAGELYLELARRDAARAGTHDYEAACAFARAHDAARAFAGLDQAVAAGFEDRAWLEQDPDLASLHGDARWTALLARLPAAPKKPPAR